MSRVKLVYGAASHAGIKRKNNEDAFKIVPSKRLFLVADGMGGHEAGEVASQMAVKKLARHFDKRDIDTLVAGVHAAHEEIYEHGKSYSHGIGTTLTALHISESGEAHYAHVGDSRIYRQRSEELKQLTRDDTLSAALVNDGTITPEQAKTFSHDSLLQAVGNKTPEGIKLGFELEVQKSRGEVQHRDVFLLCSDGLTRTVTDEEIRRKLKKVANGRFTPKKAARQLIQLANKRGGPDNTTILIIRALHKKS